VKRFATPLMLAVATSASIALSIPLGALLGVPWGGLTAGLLGGGAAFLYQLRKYGEGQATGQPEAHPTTTTEEN
jgi:hypothetical protein